MSQPISRINMIKQQLRTGNVINEKVLDLYQEIARSEFAPPAYRAFASSSSSQRHQARPDLRLQIGQRRLQLKLREKSVHPAR